MTLNRKTQQGFSLVEMMIAIILLLVIATVASTIFVENFRIINAGQSFINADWQTKIAFLHMRNDMRAAVRINTATTTTLAFDDNEGNTITYSFSGNQLLRNSQVLAKNVQTTGSSFTYYDSTGTVTAVTANIRYLIIALNMVDDYNDFTTKSTIYLWNI